MSGVLQVLAQAGSPAAGTLDPEHDLARVGEVLGPLLQLWDLTVANQSLAIRAAISRAAGCLSRDDQPAVPELGGCASRNRPLKRPRAVIGGPVPLSQPNHHQRVGVL
jgi:hypothetical protein